MEDRIDFVCARAEHQSSEPNDALTMHEDRWAYCSAGGKEPHEWQPTGGLSLDDVKRFSGRRPIRRFLTDQPSD